MISTLLISDTKDFATDYIAANLEENNSAYLRINRDLLSTYQINYDINSNELNIEIDSELFTINGKYLKSVYYRAPTFLRESFLSDTAVENQLEKTQWMAFIRNMTCFDNAIWMNNPVDIYRCENKIYQLHKALHFGLNIPKTIVSNTNRTVFSDDIIIKSIDTVVLKDHEEEMFFYTTVIDNYELKNFDNKNAPLFFQEYLKEKIDIRVTVVGDYIYACEIRSRDKSIINDDWRKHKTDVEYLPINLPDELLIKLKKLMKYFNLNFGGIDLIYYNNNYYFIEVNPTGEWAWLINKTDCHIDKEITQWLCQK